MIAAIAWGGLAAASLLLGFFLATHQPSTRMLGTTMGLGAGALISAIAYELVPVSEFDALGMALAFGLGAIAFFVGDWLVDGRGGTERKDIAGSSAGGSGAAVFIGTLLDNVPESVILGMGLAVGGAINVAFLAAVFISNLPEGVAGTVNLVAAGQPRGHVFWLWTGLVVLSAACAGLGFWAVQRFPVVDGRVMQAFAAGAMLTMLADAMMPEAFEHGGKAVGLFTAFGFLMAAVLSVAG